MKTYGLVETPGSESPQQMGGEEQFGLENFFSGSFPKPSLLQEYKGYGDLTQPLSMCLFSEKEPHLPLPAWMFPP